MSITDFMSWELLGTFAGAVAAVTLLTQFLKDAFKRLPTQWLSYIIAVVVLALSTVALRGFAIGWETWSLVPLNAVVVALAANGGYAAFEHIKNGKTE